MYNFRFFKQDISTLQTKNKHVSIAQRINLSVIASGEDFSLLQIKVDFAVHSNAWTSGVNEVNARPLVPVYCLDEDESAFKIF